MYQLTEGTHELTIDNEYINSEWSYIEDIYNEKNNHNNSCIDSIFDDKISF